jgi:hypothetical protein
VKIIDTVTYEVQSIKVGDYRKDHRHRPFMENLQDVEHSPTAYSNAAYLDSLRANKRIYVVNKVTENRQVIKDTKA